MELEGGMPKTTHARPPARRVGLDRRCACEKSLAVSLELSICNAMHTIGKSLFAGCFLPSPSTQSSPSLLAVDVPRLPFRHRLPRTPCCRCPEMDAESVISDSDSDTLAALTTSDRVA
ncbi:hypothetical protein Taro_033610 [Colocasia esculenta]|uniref:Uncharacterized protein n=1 Tax=Colocasia esculenta TaxID=4460 RepID=A0A843VVQ4_COLES|nr:hypothetical protein [Colocasia esculenta]